MSMWLHHVVARLKLAPPRQRRCRPLLECLEERCLPTGGYTAINLTSDVPGLARFTDPNLVNPWGVAYSPTGPFWFANNGSGESDPLDGRGQIVPLVVHVPPTTPSGSTPTGTVFNGGPGYIVSENGVAAPSRFLFATEDGTIAGWSGVVDRTSALRAVDNSATGAVYKGLTLATDPAGHSFLYAADFGRGTIDVFDEDFKPVALPGSFQDPNLPNGFAPFNIENINDLLFVSYAEHDSAQRDDVAGEGHGFIDVYNTGGQLLRRFASQGALNSPWGLAAAPADFAPFGGALLVGNNGDGHINAYDLRSGAFLGPLADDNGRPITIPFLWALQFGNGHAGGASDTLFFTAGTDGEAHGLFGAIQSSQRRGRDTAGSGLFDPHAPGEPGDYPLPPTDGPGFQDSIDDPAAVTAVLLASTESSLLLVPTLAGGWGLPARVDAPAAATPVVAISFQGSSGTIRWVSGTNFSPSPSVDSPSPSPASSLALNALLDLNPAPSLPDIPAGQPMSDSTPDAVGAGRSPLAQAAPQVENWDAWPSSEQTSVLSPRPGEAGTVPAQVSSEGQPESAGDRTGEIASIAKNHRRNPTDLLYDLLLPISMLVISVISLYRGRRGVPTKTSRTVRSRMRPHGTADGRPCLTGTFQPLQLGLHQPAYPALGFEDRRHGQTQLPGGIRAGHAVHSG